MLQLVTMLINILM